MLRHRWHSLAGPSTLEDSPFCSIIPARGSAPPRGWGDMAEGGCYGRPFGCPPGLTPPAMDTRVDITDHYAFQKPGDSSRTILILNVNPLAPTHADEFSSD